MPSVPESSLGAAGAQRGTISLSADRAAPRAGESVILVATASATVTGTASAIEIFDQTTATLAGGCMQSSRCQVGYSAAGGVHSFTAFITPPALTAPSGIAIASNPVQVSWLAVSVKAELPSVVGPGKPVTLTATTSVDVGALGDVLMFWDKTAGTRLTFCGSGTTCSTRLSEPDAGKHDIVAYVAGTALATPADGVEAASDLVSATWLSVVLAANTTYPRAGGTASITATTNADLTNTPWSLGIVDQSGRLIDKPCKSGSTCSARVTLTAGPIPFFSALIGTAPVALDLSTVAGQLLQKAVDRSALTNVQARSAAVQPSRLLWGVDSCKPVTRDAAGASGLYPQVDSILGKPDFWGRYLTTTPNCPGISSAEVAAAAAHNMGFLPIYNAYDCSAVAGYDTGRSYAAEATSAAASLGIPQGTVVVIDIEPPGPWCSGGIDAAFVEGWYDGVSAAGYAPGYYGDMTYGSTFETAWCAAVADRSETATGSFLWSFEPSLEGSYNKRTAPDYAPHQVGCAGDVVAWQYELSSGANPDVDHDEALSKLPLWYP
jgi:glycoside hydrolase-like protein